MCFELDDHDSSYHTQHCTTNYNEVSFHITVLTEVSTTGFKVCQWITVYVIMEFLWLTQEGFTFE